MNFDEFKKRYMAKMEAVGYEFDERDEAFNDQMAGIYLGLMIYAEYQNEQLTKQKEEYDRKLAEEMKKIKAQPTIILPGGHH